MSDSNSQAIEGYGCQCGYKTDSKTEFTKHLLQGKKNKGIHKSIGRINLLTGEKIMGPWAERSKEEQEASQYAKKGSAAARPTENLSEAQEIRFVPRVYTAPFSNIMLCAQEAAKREWGWRADMPFINFLDTVIYTFFKEHGITLQTYTVDKPDGNGAHAAEAEEILGG